MVDEGRSDMSETHLSAFANACAKRGETACGENSPLVATEKPIQSTLGRENMKDRIGSENEFSSPLGTRSQKLDQHPGGRAGTKANPFVHWYVKI